MKKEYMTDFHISILLYQNIQHRYVVIYFLVECSNVSEIDFNNPWGIFIGIKV